MNVIKVIDNSKINISNINDRVFIKPSETRVRVPPQEIFCGRSKYICTH